MEKPISAIGENYFKGGTPMASNYTENYGLCQWEATDQVLRTEFNEDNAKIDEVLASLNCQFYMQSYIGTGEDGPQTYQFPKRPVFIIIQGGTSYMCAVRGNNCIHGRMEPNSTFTTVAAWGDTSMVLGNENQSSLTCSNLEGVQYFVFAILDANS